MSVELLGPGDVVLAKSAPTIRFCALRLPPAARAANDSIKTFLSDIILLN